MGFLKRILPWLFLSFALLFSAALIYVGTHKEEILQSFMAEVNRHLDAEVKVRQAELDLFSKFPQVSVRLDDVFCPEVNGTGDTLFFFRETYFQFDLWDMVFGNYQLQTLSLEDGQIEIRYFEDGSNNYHFWKDTDDQPSDFALDLSKIRLINSSLLYLDARSSIHLTADVESGEMRGQYGDGDFSGDASVIGIVGILKVGDDLWASATPVDATGDISMIDGVFRISHGEGDLRSINVLFDGENREDGYRWALETRKADLAKFLDLLPRFVLSDRDWFKAEGSMNLSFVAEEKNGDLHMSATSHVENGRFTLTSRDFWLKELAFQATYDNGPRGDLKGSSIVFHQLQALTQGGMVYGDISIRNFESPTISAEGQLQTGLYEITQLLVPDKFNIATGALSGDFKVSNTYRSFEQIRSKGLNGASIQGDVILKEGHLSLRNSNISFENIQTQLGLRNADLQVKQASFVTGSNHFTIQGWIRNALDPTSGKIPLIDVSIQSPNIIIDEFLAWEWPESNTSVDQGVMPFNYRLSASADAFSLGNWKGSKARGQVWNEGYTIKGRNVRFETLDGSVEGTFSFGQADESHKRLIVSGNLTDIDIKQLFASFDNFGQDVLTADHIEGKGTSQLDFSIYCDNKYNFLPTSLDLIADLSIDQGRLKNYKPLESLSSFADLQELRDVRFSKLSNKVSIHKGEITIPYMQIQSSALSLDLEGTHTFNNILNYRVKMKMRDALGGAKKKPRNIDDWIVETDRPDEPYLWVKMTGHIDNPVIAIDKGRIAEGIKNEWKEEGKELKDLIKGKDPEKKPQKTQPEYIFEWGEENPDTTQNSWNQSER
ncbi:MAG: AsmA-like C-terminal region-containing protein [Bacteroidota bacterium]|nr:AsmA-like C-terminal region-containing protein [Bacteroidota bacterium]MDX5504883.1 AsmA-like C-terminal region-containing protein [Bacteroidota bacterium]